MTVVVADLDEHRVGAQRGNRSRALSVSVRPMGSARKLAAVCHEGKPTAGQSAVAWSLIVSFDVIVLAVGPAARSHKVCGLTLAERGRRLANKLGATRVLLVDSIESAKQLPGWVADRDVLVLRVADQVVHFPLVEAVKGGGARIAVGPDGAYAGAIWVPRADAPQVATALAADPEHGDTLLAEHWRASHHATEHVHGEIARHRAVTAAERKAATRMLFQVINKSQDGPLTKYWLRPIAYPITRAFLPTPLTPNHVTAIAACSR